MTAKLKNIPINPKNRLAANLGHLMARKKLSVVALAQALGLPMMTVRRLVIEETTDPRISTLKLIADYFGVTVDFLLEGTGLPTTDGVRISKPQVVPVLDWAVAAKNHVLSELELSQWRDWQPVSVTGADTLSDSAFGLESRPSMYPKYPHGSLFIIDPAASPVDGDVVLVKIKKTSDLTLRELTVDPPQWQLHPIAAGSSVLAFDEKAHEIIGTVIMTLLYHRKGHG